MAEFDRMRAKVLAMLASREWRAARKAEDPTMVRHIPQLVRINKLGLLTFDSQAGRKDRAYAERAYCFGFVRDRESALRLTQWVSLNTDKYASLVVVQGNGPDPRNKFVASAVDVMLRRTAGHFPCERLRRGHLHHREPVRHTGKPAHHRRRGPRSVGRRVRAVCRP